MTTKELRELKGILTEYSKSQDQKLADLSDRLKGIEEKKEQPKLKDLSEIKIEIIGVEGLTLAQRQEFIIKLRALMREHKIYSVNMTFEKKI